MVYLRSTVNPVLSAARTSGLVFYLPFRDVSGLYSAGLRAATNTRNLKSWKPSVNAPLTDEQGRITPAWNQFINYLIETVLGGSNFATLPDIANFATTSQVESIANNAIVQALKAQGTANAQALAAVVQVAQVAALPGATQIPPVQLVNDLW